MSGAISIEIAVTRDQVSPFIYRYLEVVGDRTGMNMAIGEAERDMFRDYLIDVTGTRHETAEALGAEPTGHWGRAAETLSFTATRDAAILSIHDPAASRAGHDVTIVPREGKEWLTIPLIRQAYNQLARRVEGLFRPFARTTGAPAAREGVDVGWKALPERARVLAKKGPDGKLEFWYALVRSVTQRQDRTLLPPDNFIAEAAKKGMRDFFLFEFGRAA